VPAAPEKKPAHDLQMPASLRHARLFVVPGHRANPSIRVLERRPATA